MGPIADFPKDRMMSAINLQAVWLVLVENE